MFFFRIVIDFYVYLRIFWIEVRFMLIRFSNDNEFD